MDKVIAIHNSKGGYHQYWVSYCQEKNIPFKLVNCYSTDIIEQLKGCSALMWHHNHAKAEDIILAKRLLFALGHLGFIVYPDFKSNWHFDDKVGQKYLLEQAQLPLVPVSLFVSEKEALVWAETATFPKVFKLSGGAGSLNVKLVKTRSQAIAIIKKAFGKGFSRYYAWSRLKDRVKLFSAGKATFKDVLKGVVRLVIKPKYASVLGRERGYVYFQDFVPNLDRDYRTKVIGDKCWGYQRLVREGDFRASGSGSDSYIYTDDAIPDEIIKLSFQITEQLSLNSVAYDFVIDSQGKIYIIELSCFFGFNDKQHHGYWDRDLVWHKTRFNPFGWMVDNVLEQVKLTT